MESTRDDSLLRWQNQSELAKYVWNYFNDVIARQIVIESIDKKNTLTLTTLYRRLVLARAECEWIKIYLSNYNIVNSSHNPINEAAINNIYLSFPKEFFNFQFGGSTESCVYDDTSWGEAISEFVKKRKSDYSFQGMSRTSPSVGSFVEDYFMNLNITHPSGSILEKIEPDFQQLCNATNLFEYLKVASRLMFALSNFPPVTRGSAAVNTWIIDIIAQEKFNLTATATMRPALHDWTAYFETPEQYTSFYVISASVQYVKSLDKIKKIDVFEHKLLISMKENPNISVNLQLRENLWNELKSIIKAELENNSELNDSEKQRLHEIVSGNLIFRKPSERILSIIKTIEQNADVINNLPLLLSADDTQYLKELLQLKHNAGILFLSSYRTENEEKTNLMWPDCEALNQLVTSTLAKLMIQFKLYKAPIVTKEEKELNERMDYIRENSVCKAGFILPENIHQYTKLLELTQDFQDQVSIALINGMDLNELNQIILQNEVTSKHIKILTSRAAVLLYKLKDKISIENLVSSYPEESEMKILNLIASKYCNNDNLESISNAEVRNCLLLYLDPCLFKYKKLSELVGKSLEETQENILSVFLEHYNFTSLALNITNENRENFLDIIINYNPIKHSSVASLAKLLNIEPSELKIKQDNTKLSTNPNLLLQDAPKKPTRNQETTQVSQKPKPN